MGSNESLYSNSSNTLFTPPVLKSKNSVFFSSDDSLFKTEKRKFVIPRIEIQSDEPVFSLQVTDFSDPAPKNVTLTYDESGQSMKLQKVEEYIKPKTKAQEFAQNKSYSIDVNSSNVDISSISEIDKFLSIGTKKLSRQKATSTSLIDLSSSTSSINSCIYESNLDLSQLDPDTPLKHWKSPFEMRHGKNLNKDNKATSDPSLNKKKFVVNSSRSKSVSEENLNDKLTEYERLEILKLLHDWSLNGSDSKSEFNMNLNPSKSKSTDNIDSIIRDDENIALLGKFLSEPDLSPKSRQCRLIPEKPIILGKYSSESRLSTTSLEDDFLHRCKYRNCIFNIDFVPKSGPPKLKSILKNSKEKLDVADSLKDNADNIINLQMNEQFKSTCTARRYSETIQPNNAVNSHLARCDSLERLTQLHKPNKFPDSYIVTRRGSQRLKNGENGRPKSPKIIVLRKKCMPKTWKSCSDIKPRKQVKKCCKYAKKSCPVLRNSSDSPKKNRKTKSCACISEENILESVSEGQMNRFTNGGPTDVVLKPCQRVCFANGEIANRFQDGFSSQFDGFESESDDVARTEIVPMPRQRPGFAKQYSLGNSPNSRKWLGTKTPFKPLNRQNTVPEQSRCCSNLHRAEENDNDPFFIKSRDGICFGGQQQHASARLEAGFFFASGSACLVHRKLTIQIGALSLLFLLTAL